MTITYTLYKTDRCQSSCRRVIVNSLRHVDSRTAEAFPPGDRQCNFAKPSACSLGDFPAPPRRDLFVPLIRQARAERAKVTSDDVMQGDATARLRPHQITGNSSGNWRIDSGALDHIDDCCRRDAHDACAAGCRAVRSGTTMHVANTLPGPPSHAGSTPTGAYRRHVGIADDRQRRRVVIMPRELVLHHDRYEGDRHNVFRWVTPETPPIAGLRSDSAGISITGGGARTAFRDDEARRPGYDVDGTKSHMAALKWR